MIQRFFLGFLPALAVTLAIGACSGGGTYDFAAASPTVAVTSEQSISAAVIDQRPYVLSGKESTSFVGTTRGNYSNIVDVKTESGRPFADELTDVVVDALDRRGVAAAALPLPKGTADDKLLEAFRAQGTERLLVVQMYEWQTNAYTRVTAQWEMEAIVYDRDGDALARRRTQGQEPIGSTTLGGDSSGVAIREVTEKLSILLSDPGIASALK